MRLTQLIVPAADAEVAADRLWRAGASAIEEDDAGDRVRLTTLLAGDDDTSRMRLGDLPGHWTVAFVDGDDAPSQAWRDHAQPVEVNDELVLQPAWQPAAGDHGRTVVMVEPGGSFGLGDHPTTRLSADAIWRLTSAGDRVLDVGCGSGVLGIVAALRGAASITAIDVAEAAREATVDNARRNGVAECVDASCIPLTQIEGRYELVVANILAPTLIELADHLRRVLAPSGTLVISGLLADHHDHVVRALEPLTVVAVDVLDSWACVTLRSA